MLNITTVSRRATLSLMAVVGIALLSAPAAVAGEQDFTLHNNTGKEIHKLYVAPHSSDDWNDDILGQSTLADGDSLNIKFSHKTRAAHWDLRIEDENGNSVTWESLNLLEISEVTLHYKNGKAWADFQ